MKSEDNMLQPGETNQVDAGHVSQSVEGADAGVATVQQDQHESDRTVFFANKLTSRQKLTLRFAAGVLVLSLVVGVGGSIFGWPFGDQTISQASGDEAIVSGDDPKQVSLLPVECIQVQSSERYQVTRQYAGTVRAANQSELGFVNGGRVESIHVDDGQVVDKDATLAELDVRPFQFRHDQIAGQLAAANAKLEELVNGPRDEELGRATARLEQLKVALAKAEATLRRREVLAKNQATSEEELDQWRFDVLELKAQVEEAQFQLNELNEGSRREQIEGQRASVRELEASLHQAEVDLEYAKLAAPFSGVVVERRMDPGEIAAAGQTLLILQSKEREVWIGFPEPVAHQFSIGDEVELRQSTNTIQVKVESILPQVDPSTRTRAVVFKPLPESQLDPVGSIVRTTVSQQVDGHGIWIPATALSPSSQGLWAVFVVEESAEGNPVVRRRDVELIHMDNDRAYVRGTLSDGDNVVVNGIHRLVPGQKVRVLGD